MMQKRNLTENPVFSIKNPLFRHLLWAEKFLLSIYKVSTLKFTMHMSIFSVEIHIKINYAKLQLSKKTFQNLVAKVG